MRRQRRARPPRRRPGDAMRAALLPPRKKKYPTAKRLSHLLIHFLYVRPGSTQIPFNLVAQEVVSDLRRQRPGRRWMSTDSQLLLTAWYERRDFEARRRLIEAHLPLVRALASRFVRGRGAARGSRSGRVGRPDQGRRPVRPAPRLVADGICRPDHRRRDPASPSRRHATAPGSPRAAWAQHRASGAAGRCGGPGPRYGGRTQARARRGAPAAREGAADDSPGASAASFSCASSAA